MKYLVLAFGLSLCAAACAAEKTEKSEAPNPVAVDEITARRAEAAANKYTDELAQAQPLSAELEEAVKSIEALLEDGRARYNDGALDKAGAVYVAVTESLEKLRPQRQVLGKRYKDLQAESLALGRLLLDNSPRIKAEPAKDEAPEAK